MKPELLRAELADTIHQLEQGIDDLCAILRQQHDYPIWGWRQEEPAMARLEALQMIRAIEYEENQPGNETRIYPALMGTSREGLEAAEVLNRTKTRLGKLLAAMRGHTIDARDACGRQRPIDLLRHALAFLKHPRLHSLQATRHLVVCPQAPARVGFTWITGSSRVGRTDRDTLIAQLEARLQKNPEDEGLHIDLERLARLAPGEPLAHYRAPKVHPRANIKYVKATGEVERVPKPAMMPILFPSEPGGALPPMKPLEDTVPPPGSRRKKRAARGAVRVDPERYLITQPIHRYREASAS